jgi:O-antigen/teichoic acid export membrane protein
LNHFQDFLSDIAQTNVSSRRTITHTARGVESLSLVGEPETMKGNTERHTRLVQAIASSAASKMLAVLIQLLALPLALSTLGTSRYAAFLSLQALFGWVSLCAVGLVPSLPRFLTGAYVRDNQTEQRAIVKSSMLFMGSVALLLLIGLLAIGLAVPPLRMISAQHVSSNEIEAAYFLAATLSCVQFAASIAPAIRGGFQELHRVNIAAVVANICVILLLIGVFQFRPQIGLLFVVLYGPLALLLIVDMILLLIARPYLAIGPARVADTIRHLLPHSLNALAKQVAYFAITGLPVLIVAFMTDPRSTAAYASGIQVLLLAVSGVGIVFQSFVPALADAQSRHDHHWVRSVYRKGLVTVLVIGGVTVIGLATVGPYLARAWLHPNFSITHEFTASLGVFFFFWLLSDFNFFVLSALGHLIGTGKLFVAESAVGVGLGTLLTLKFGILGMPLGIACAMGLVGSWYLPLLISHKTRERSAGSL